jgi:RNA polymerase sigma factor for flagellar operon FliA
VRATAKRMRHGSRDELVEGTLAIALACISRFVARLPEGLDVDAVRGAAFEALVEAAERWDPTRSSQYFSTYAWRRMWGAMQDECRGLDPNSRSARARGETRRAIALEAEIEGTEGLTYADVLNDPNEDLAGDLAARCDLAQAVARLSPRQRFVVLAFAEGYRNREIGSLLGVSESRVSQIRTAAARKIRRDLAAYSVGIRAAA